MEQVGAKQDAIRTHIVRDPDSFARLRPQWNTLFARAGNACFALHHDWLDAWLDINASHYVAGDRGLRVVCCSRGDDLVSVLPLYLRRASHLTDSGNHLCFIGTGEAIADEICPDYLDALSLPADGETCARMHWDTIYRDLEPEYDRVELCKVADQSAMVRWARANSSERDLQLFPGGACPIADLSGGFEAYLSRLSSNTRQQGRRLLRAAGQAGVVFEVAQDARQAQRFFDEMIRLHQARWTSAGEPGCFASERFTRFHRRIVEQWVPSGQAIVSRIRLGDQTLAAKYGFRFGPKYDFYQSGVLLDEACPIKSPGIVSFLLLMQYLAGHGVSTFDFLSGSSGYKQRLATGAQPLVELRRILWTWHTCVGFVANLAARSARRIARIGRHRPTGDKAPAIAHPTHVTLQPSPSFGRAD